MRRNKINVKMIKNLIILIMAIILIIGIYYNIKKSKAEEIVTITAKIVDEDEKVKNQEIQLTVNKNQEQIYTTELPEFVNENKIEKYTTFEGKEIIIKKEENNTEEQTDNESKTNIDVEKSENLEDTYNRKIEIAKEDIIDNQILLRVKYDKKEIEVDENENIIQESEKVEGKESNKTITLYNKKIKNDDEKIEAEGYMPLNSEIIIRNIEEEYAKSYEIRIYDEDEQYDFTKYNENIVASIENEWNIENAFTQKPNSELIEEKVEDGKIEFTLVKDTSIVIDFEEKTAVQYNADEYDISLLFDPPGTYCSCESPSPDGGNVWQQPTCTSSGKTDYYCTNCGKRISGMQWVNEPPALGHSTTTRHTGWDNPTCTNSGCEWDDICDRCGQVATHGPSTSPLYHTGGTFENNGKCTRCGSTYISYSYLSTNFASSIGINKDKIESITFTDSLSRISGTQYDVAQNQSNGYVYAKKQDSDGNGLYEVYITSKWREDSYGDGRSKIYQTMAPVSSSLLFGNMTNLKEINGQKNFCTRNVTSMDSMFWNCQSLTNLDVSNFDTTNVTVMTGMFMGCQSLTNLDVSKFNTTNVKNMGAMFARCNSLTGLDLSNFDTSNVIEIGGMFSNCQNLTSLNVSKFKTTNVKNMGSMFFGCQSLTSLDVSNFNTANVTDMSYMFYGCQRLTSLDVSNFNTAKVTNMSYMFNNCKALASLDVSGFNTAKVTNMSYMFSECNSLTSLNLSGFDTSNVTNMSNMLNGCSSLTGLNLSKFNTKKVTDMSSMFQETTSLTSLDLGKRFTKIADSHDNMFTNCGNSSTKIYSPEAIYSTAHQFTTGPDSSTTIDYTVGTVILKYYPTTEWDSSASNLTKEGNKNSINFAFTIKDSEVDTTSSKVTTSNFQNFMTIKLNDVNVTEKASITINNITNGIQYILHVEDTDEGKTLGTTIIDGTKVELTITPKIAGDIYGNRNIGMTLTKSGLPINDKKPPVWSLKETPTMISKTEIKAIIKGIDLDNNVSTELIEESWTISLFNFNTKIEVYENGAKVTSGITVQVSDIQTISDKEVQATITLTGISTTSNDLYIVMKTGTLKDSEENSNKKTKLYLMSSLKVSEVESLNGDSSNASFLGSTEITRSNINKIVFTSSIEEVKKNSTSIWTVDSRGTGSIVAGYKNGIVYIGSDGIIFANKGSTYLFAYTSVTEIENLTKLNTSRVTSMVGMFANCHSLTVLDLSNFDTSNVISINAMFDGASKIITLDLRSFNTEKVNSMVDMFFGCQSLENLNISSFNTSKVTRTDGMFGACQSLKKLDLSNFDTSKVTNMQNMFRKCSSLISLNINNFNTTNVTNMNSMFMDCSSLISLDLGKKFTKIADNHEDMFKNCGTPETNIYVAEAIYSNTKQLKTGANSINTIDITNGTVNVKYYPEIKYISSKIEKVNNKIIYTVIFDVTDDEMSAVDCSLSKISAMMDTTDLSLTTSNTKILSSDINKGKRCTVKIQNENIIEAKTVTISLGKGIGTDLYGNTNLVTTITTGINEDIDNKTEIGDIENPKWSIEDSSAEPLNKNGTIAIANIQGKDENYASNTLTAGTYEANAISSKIKVYVNGRVTTSGIKIEVSSATTIANGVKYTITVKGYVQNANQVKIRMQAGTLKDTNGNTNEETEFIIFNQIVSASEESEGVLAFLGGNKTREEITGKIKIVNTKKQVNDNTTTTWDISAQKDNSIIAGYNDSTKDVYIGSDYKIYANRDASYMFANTKATSIEGLNNLNTCNSTNMYNMFMNCNSLTSLDASKFNTTNVTNMTKMFANCGSLTSVDVSNFDTSNVIYMVSMFMDCSSLTSLNVSSFNTANVINMRYMFSVCGSLTSIDIRNFNTTKVNDMAGMFWGCSNLTALELSNFDTTNVTDMSIMFNGCSKLTNLNIRNFNTANVTRMENMFRDCSSLISLDISNFNTKNVTIMNWMFLGCNSLTKLDLGKKFTKIADNHEDMFKNCGTPETNIYVAEAIYSNTKQLKTGANSINTIDITNGTVNVKYYPEIKYISSKIEKISNKIIYTVIFDVTDDEMSTVNCSLSKISAMMDTTDLSLTTSNTKILSSDINKGKRYTVKIQDENIITAKTVTISLEKGIGTDLYGNTNLVTTITTGINEDIDNKTEIGDIENPKWSLEDSSAEPLNKNGTIAIANIQGKDENYASNTLTPGTYEANAISSKVKVYVDGRVTTSGIKIEVSSATTIANGVKYTITVKGYAQNANQVKISMQAGTLKDTNGNTNEEAEFIIFNQIVSASGETNNTSAFLGGAKTREEITGKIKIVNTKKQVNDNTTTTWDISAQKDNSIIAGYNDSTKDVYIGSDYKIYANRDASYMFAYTMATSIEGLNNLNTCNSTAMVNMFRNCENLINLDISNFDTTNVIYMDLMFGFSNKITTLDLRSFNTEKVTSMIDMFYGCNSLENLNISSFNTAKVTRTDGMFGFCLSLQKLDVSGFDTSKVTSMQGMFRSCRSLISLDISNFNIENVTNMNRMFMDCSSLTSLDLGKKFTKIADNHEDMLKNCGTSETKIYVPESIYYNKNGLKLNGTATTEAISYTTGTILCKYRIEWTKVSNKIVKGAREYTLEVVIQAKGLNTTYLSSTLSTKNIHIYIDGELADDGTNVSKKLSTKKSISEGVQYTLTLGSFEQKQRQNGKAYMEWSGNVSILIDRGTAKDSFGNGNIETEIKDETTDKNTDGKLFFDKTAPEIKYVSYIKDMGNKELKITLDVVDKYLNTNYDIKIEHVLLEVMKGWRRKCKLECNIAR